MAYTAEKLLEIARGEIGYIEKETNSQLDSKTANAGDNNWTKYARDLYNAGYYNGNKNGFAWCDMFVDWVHYIAAGKNADEAQRVICQYGPYGAGCEWSAKYYQEAGRYYTSNPEPGDQIFFSNFAHTGIVEKVENGVITTIEGNTSNMVARRTCSIYSSNIDGYGRPRYDGSNSTSSSATTKPNNSTASTTSANVTYKVGDVVDFVGTKHYVSANASTGPACKPGKAKITATYDGKHPYHLVALPGSGSTVYGWVDKNDISGGTTSSWTPSVGDIVNFTGNKHYVNANAATGPSCKPGKAKITSIYQVNNSKHPYHLVNISGGGSDVYGWVDAGTFTKA